MNTHGFCFCKRLVKARRGEEQLLDELYKQKKEKGMWQCQLIVPTFVPVCKATASALNCGLAIDGGRKRTYWQSMRPQKKGTPIETVLPSQLCKLSTSNGVVMASPGNFRPSLYLRPRRFLQLFLAVRPLSQIIKSVKATCSSLGCDQPDTDICFPALSAHHHNQDLDVKILSLWMLDPITWDKI